MRLLDCGCGPGTITAGVAAAVAPGRVDAVDIEPSQVERARAYAANAGLTNVAVSQANVNSLPFPDETFDAVLAHAVLQHVRSPLEALREMSRVLKPGGVIGLRDDDQGSLLLTPDSPDVLRLIDLSNRVAQRLGFNPYLGRRHRELLRKAGLVDVRVTAACQCDGTSAETELRALVAVESLERATDQMTALGLATPDELRVLREAVIAWGRHPDAISIITWCEAVGRKPSYRS
jgi:SAM-dependent methyltransferase